MDTTVTDRALLLHWSSAWDNPRFRGDGCVHPALDHGAVTPLLRVASSCVSEVRRQIGENSQLPPFGSSRELLVAALDGDTKLSPADKPQIFVRSLVHASFQTPDGAYVGGLDGDELDSIIDAHCAGQLEEAVQVVQNPNLKLQLALAAVTKSVEDLLAMPQQQGLYAVAKRVLLANKLDRFAKEAAAMAKEDPVPSEDAAEAVCADSDDAPLAQRDRQRTKSQVLSSVQVQKVKAHLDEHRDPIRELRQTTSSLEQKLSDSRSETCGLQDTLDAVHNAQKRARNFGEDLVDDMLALDKLSNLTPEDRSQRKAAITGIETLLDDVDSAKNLLASLQRNIESKIAEKATASLQQQEPVSPGVARRREDLVQDALRMAAAVPPPNAEDWRQVRLSQRFYTQEEVHQFVIMATAPCLDVGHLKITLGEDKSLRVEGLQLPNGDQLVRMQQRVGERLKVLARTFPERFGEAKDVKKTAMECYFDVGQGEFGLFTEVFRIPPDVNGEGITASYVDCVLRVILPKHVLDARARPVYQTPVGRGQPPLFGFRDSRNRW